MEKKILIEGMSCGHCVKHVKEALTELDGVTNVDVSLGTKTAILVSSADISDEAIKAAINEVGYEVVGVE